MRGPVLRILSVSLCPPLQRPFFTDSPIHISPLQPQKYSRNQPHRRWYDLDLTDQWQSGNETSHKSAQAGRGPPCRSRLHVVRESSFTSFININKWRFDLVMNYRNITLAVVGLALSLSFLAVPAMAAEKDGVTMKDGKMIRLQEGKDIGRMDRETTMSNGTRVMMNGKMVMKDGKEMQLQEGQIMMLDGKLIEGGK